MTWIDPLIVVVLAAIIALAARRRLAGAVFGLGGVLLWLPLVLVAGRSPLLALGLAALAAVGLAAGAHVAGQRDMMAPRLATLVGGLGGLGLAAVFALTLATALPLERSAVQPDRFFYPPTNLPSPLGQAVQNSAFFGLGRDILFSGSEGLYRLFFPDRPWTAAP